MRKKYLKMPNKKIKAVEKNMVIVKLKKTKTQLVESIKIEFAKKDYMKAPLRKACTNVWITTGAMHFSFMYHIQSFLFS